MKKPSAAQAKIIAMIQGGGRLALDAKSGRYTVTELSGKVIVVDQRPVIVMIRDGILAQDMTGICRVVSA